MTKIEWTKNADGSQGKTWNPTRGCSRVSPGCDRCYAMRFAHARHSGEGKAYEGLTTIRKGKVDWTGHAVFVPEQLAIPLRVRKPTTWFVDSMSDLFHGSITNEQIAAVFGVMAACPQHTFQCLTKRADRMRALLTDPDFPFLVFRARDAALVDHEHAKSPTERWAPIPSAPGYEASSHGRIRSDGSVRKSGQELRQHLNDHEQIGRYAVTLYRDGGMRTEFVHRLVLLAFHGAPQDGEEACHRNGNKLDNRLVNLRWGSRSDNQRDKVNHGARGGPAKLTPSQVAEIRAARKGGATQQSIADRFGVSRSLISMIEHDRVWSGPELPWPLPNVHLGVSVESTDYLHRIADLLECPASIHWVSAEPLLGPLDLRPYLGTECPHEESYSEPDTNATICRKCDGASFLSWVIVGGESGPGARLFDLAWARSIVDQCKTAGVACFVKQLGAKPYESEDPRMSGLDDDAAHLLARGEMLLKDRKGGDPSEWPEDLRVREMPKAAGELFPEE